MRVCIILASWCSAWWRAIKILLVQLQRSGCETQLPLLPEQRQNQTQQTTPTPIYIPVSLCFNPSVCYFIFLSLGALLHCSFTLSLQWLHSTLQKTAGWCLLINVCTQDSAVLPWTASTSISCNNKSAFCNLLLILKDILRADELQIEDLNTFLMQNVWGENGDKKYNYSELPHTLLFQTVFPELICCILLRSHAASSTLILCQSV